MAERNWQDPSMGDIVIHKFFPSNKNRRAMGRVASGAETGGWEQRHPLSKSGPSGGHIKGSLSIPMDKRSALTIGASVTHHTGSESMWLKPETNFQAGIFYTLKF